MSPEASWDQVLGSALGSRDLSNPKSVISIFCDSSCAGGGSSRDPGRLPGGGDVRHKTRRNRNSLGQDREEGSGKRGQRGPEARMIEQRWSVIERDWKKLTGRRSL